MGSEEELQEARAEAEAILALRDADLTMMFFTKMMRRNLARSVRHLDRLVVAGGKDEALGKAALKKLGFDP